MVGRVRLGEFAFDYDLNEDCPIAVSPSSNFFALNLSDKIVLFEYGVNATISSLECNRHQKFIDNLSFKQSEILPQKFLKRTVGEFANKTPEIDMSVHVVPRLAKFMKLSFSPPIAGEDLLAIITDDYELKVYQNAGGRSSNWEERFNITEMLYKKAEDAWRSPIRTLNEYNDRRCKFEITEVCWNSHVDGDKSELAFATRDGVIHFANVFYSKGFENFDLILQQRQIRSHYLFVHSLLLRSYFLLCHSSCGRIGLYDLSKEKEYPIFSQEDNYPTNGIAFQESDGYLDVFFIKPEGCLYRSTISKADETQYLNLIYQEPEKKCIKSLYFDDNVVYITLPRSLDYTYISLDLLPELPYSCSLSDSIRSTKKAQILQPTEASGLTLYGFAQSRMGLIRVAIFARNNFSAQTDRPNNVKTIFFTDSDISAIFDVISNNLDRNQCDFVKITLFIYRQAIYQAFNDESFFIPFKKLFHVFVEKFKSLNLKELLGLEVVFMKFARNVGLRLKEYCDIFNTSNESFERKQLEDILKKLDIVILKSMFESWFDHSPINVKNKLLMIDNMNATSLEHIVSICNIDKLAKYPLKCLNKNSRDLIAKVMKGSVEEAIKNYSIKDESNFILAANSKLSVEKYFNCCPLCDAFVPEVGIECMCSGQKGGDRHIVMPCANSLILSNINVQMKQCYTCVNSWILSTPVWSISGGKDKCIYCL